MPSYNFDLVLDARFKRAINDFSRFDLSKTAGGGLEEYARSIERGAKIMAPKDTGHMASKIATRKQLMPFGIDRYEVRSVVGGPAPYNYFVHEGTRKMRARPFMMWGLSYAQHLFNIDNELTRSMDKEIKRHFE